MTEFEVQKVHFVSNVPILVSNVPILAFNVSVIVEIIRL